jgi:uncharacterized membrane protein YgdD (TMEM256/DUF423 family)
MSYAIVIAAVAGGLLIGAGAMSVARRSGQTHEQSVQRQRIVQYFFVVLVAAILTFDAIDTPRHRWFNTVVLALMAGGLVFDRIKARRRRTMS